MTKPTTPPDQFTVPVDQDARNAEKNRTDAISKGYLLIRKIGIVGAVVFSLLCFVAALSPKRPSTVTTLEEACRSSLIKLEEVNYGTFQINNVESLAPGKFQLFYEVGHSIGPYANQIMKERQLAICTGTISRPAIELVSVNAKKNKEAAEAAASQAALEEAETSLQAELQRFKALEAQYSAQ